MENVDRKRGRPLFMEDAAAVVDALRGVKGVEGHKLPTRHIQWRLVEAGLAEFTWVKTPGRGRARKVTKLTQRGHARVNFAK